jgi:hypothetical protein
LFWMNTANFSNNTGQCMNCPSLQPWRFLLFYRVNSVSAFLHDVHYKFACAG